MAPILIKLWNDQQGAVISAELVAVMTCSVLAIIVGLKTVSDSVNAELHDLAQAIGSLNQSFAVDGIAGCRAFVAGSSFLDSADPCDISPLSPNCPTPEFQEQMQAHPDQSMPSPIPMPPPMQEGPDFPAQPQERTHSKNGWQLN